MVDVKPGKKAARHDPRTLVYAKYRTATEPPPPDAHWGRGLPFDTDKGTDMLTAVGYWKSTGLGGQQITAYAALNPLDQAQMCEAIAWYGGAYIGLQLPLSAQNHCDEAFVLLATDWIAASGQSPSRMAWGQLLADLQNL